MTDSRQDPPTQAGARAEDPFSDSRYIRLRYDMVERQLRARDIDDPRVLEAMGRVPRHAFVLPGERDEAYTDQALPLTEGQTISQPYIVALMTQLVRPQPDSKCLDVGTGSGYQAAVLADLCREVYSIEIVESLAREARSRLRQLGYDNVEVRHGDGFGGWPEQAPFDVIVVAAAPRDIPQPLIDQLAPGGRLVIPVGEYRQHLVLVEKDANGRVIQHPLIPVAFVPMTGEAEKR
jgi:protein-L-isoaspartate(D-aspartate) O-methyltransferase